MAVREIKIRIEVTTHLGGAVGSELLPLTQGEEFDSQVSQGDLPSGTCCSQGLPPVTLGFSGCPCWYGAWVPAMFMLVPN